MVLSYDNSRSIAAINFGDLAERMSGMPKEVPLDFHLESTWANFTYADGRRIAPFFEAWRRLNSRLEPPAFDWIFMNEVERNFVDSKLKALETLEDDWDSYGGRAPTNGAVSGAKRLLIQLQANPIFRSIASSDELNSYPEPNGGIELEWAVIGTTHRLSLFINEAGTLEGYFISGELGSLRIEKEAKFSVDSGLAKLLAGLPELTA